MRTCLQPPDLPGRAMLDPHALIQFQAQARAFTLLNRTGGRGGIVSNCRCTPQKPECPRICRALMCQPAVPCVTKTTAIATPPRHQRDARNDPARWFPAFTCACRSGRSRASRSSLIWVRRLMPFLSALVSCSKCANCTFALCLPLFKVSPVVCSAACCTRSRVLTAFRTHQE